VAKGLSPPVDRMYANLDLSGKHLCRLSPDRLAGAVNQRRVKVRDRILLVAFGAEFTSAAVTIEWTADPARGIAGDESVMPDDVNSACLLTATLSIRSRRHSPY
jgi:hypothetical protein